MSPSSDARAAPPEPRTAAMPAASDPASDAARQHHLRWSMGADDWGFARRVGIALGLGAMAYAVWRLASVLLLLFAAALLGIILRAVARRLSSWTGLRLSWCITATTLMLVAFVAGFAWLFGAQMAAHAQQLYQQLPTALSRVGQMVGIELSSERVLEQAKTFARAGVPGVLGFGSSALGVLADLLVIFVGGVYFASDASTYRRGIALLFPEPQRQRLLHAAEEAAHALSQWFFGQLVAMAAVGLASWAAFAWIGLPSAGALAIIMGVADFVPMVGPIIGAVPALIVAGASGVEPLLWTAGAIFVVQQLESYALMPYIQKRAVDLPPAVGIFSIVVFGSLFGVMGVVLAVPLAVVVFVLVQRLWVNQVLGEDVEVIGQESQDSGARAEKREA